MAKSRAIANLAVVISARTKRFERGFARANKRLKKFGRSIVSATAGIRRFGALLLGAIGIGSIAAFTASLIKSVEALDNLAKSSDRLKIGPKRLAGLRLAAKLAGMEVEKLDLSLVYLRRRVSEAASGMGEGLRAFEMMGLSAENLINLPLDQQLARVADGMRGLSNQSDRVRVAMDLFGRSGAGMLNLLAGGSKAFDDATTKAKRFGTAIGRFELAKVEAFNDAMTEMKEALSGLRHGLAVKLSVPLTIITEHLTDMIVNATDFGNVMVEGFIKAAAAAGWLASAVNEVRAGIEGLRMAVLNAAIETLRGKPMGIQLPDWAIKPVGPFAGVWALQKALTPEGLTKGQAAAGLEAELAAAGTRFRAVDTATDFMEKWSMWVKRAIEALRIEVRERENQIRAARWGAGGMIGAIYRGALSRFGGGPAAGASIATAGRAQWMELSRTRSAFPSGVAAAAKNKAQAVTDKPIFELLQKAWNWIQAHPAEAQTLGWALVK